MTPNSPTARRGLAGRLLSAGTAAAAAAALSCSAVIPAFADTVPPLVSGNAHEPAASARIAYVDWCDRGAVGAVGTAESDGPSKASAGWNHDPHEVAGGRHFPHTPADAYSSVVRDGDRITAAAGISDVRFTPACRSGTGAAAPIPVAEAFDRDALLALDSAASSAWWSDASGPRAEITVRGLEILGRPADVSDGDYARTFTADTGEGTITVAVSAERGVSQPADRPSDSGRSQRDDSVVRRAAAWLSVRFEVARVDAEGKPISGFDYAVEFAGAAVHVPAGMPDPSQSPTPDGGGASSPGATDTEPDDSGHTAGSGGGSQDGSGGSGGTASDAPTDRPTGGEESGGAAPPGTLSGGSAAGGQSPPSGGGGGGGGTDEAPTQKDPAPGPTVAAPTDPEEAPSVDPGGGTDPAEGDSDGRLPVAGSALVGLVVTGLAALGGGGTAIYLGRGRKSGFDGDDIGAHRHRHSRSADDWP